MSSAKITDPAYIEMMLASLRVTFLNELPERVAELERLTMALGSSSANTTVYDDLYGRVHSLKGSAGTHGLPIISTICHQFEDLLNTADTEANRSGRALADHGLRYVDLIGQALNFAREGRSDFKTIEQALLQMQRGSEAPRLVGLVAESSATMAGMYRDALVETSVSLTFVRDGLEALGRLLHERFDFLVAGNNLKTLNGMALISALRLSNAPNRSIPVILLTSVGSEPPPATLRVDHVIARDPNLPQRLVQAIQALGTARQG